MIDVHTHIEREEWTAIWDDDREKQELRRNRKRYWKVRIAKEQIDLKIVIMKTLRTMNKMKKKEKQESGPGNVRRTGTKLWEN